MRLRRRPRGSRRGTIGKYVRCLSFQSCRARLPATPHARTAENTDALRQGPENFLVPNRWNAVEITVNQANGFGPRERCPKNITLLCRWMEKEITARRQIQ